MCFDGGIGRLPVSKSRDLCCRARERERSATHESVSGSAGVWISPSPVSFVSFQVLQTSCNIMPVALIPISLPNEILTRPGLCIRGTSHNEH